MLKRIGVFILVLATATAAVLFAPKFQIFSGTAVTSNKLSVAAQDMRLICPGAAIISGGANGTKVGTFARTGKASVLGSSSQQAGIQALNGVAKSAIGALNFGAQSSALISQTQQQQGSVALNAGQLQNVANARLNGLLGSSCQAPSTDLWLIGGDTSTGRETLLLLVNPSSVDATVSVEAIGLGAAKASSSGISVPAHLSTVVPVSSILPDTKSLALHVRSYGSSIAAWMQQRTLRGLSYAGADFVSAVEGFSSKLQVPGILIRGSNDAVKLANSNADYFDLVPTLRIYNPTSETVNFVAQIFGANDKSFGTVIRDSVPANSVSDFAISGLSDGDYAAFIQADAAVGAAVRLPRVTNSANPITDFAWLPAAQPLVGKNAITVPAAGIAKLSVTNSKSGSIAITIDGVSITLPSGSTRVLQVANGKNVLIDSGGNAIEASLIVDIGGNVTALPVVSYQNTGANISVLVR